MDKEKEHLLAVSWSHDEDGRYIWLKPTKLLFSGTKWPMAPGRGMQQ